MAVYFFRQEVSQKSSREIFRWVSKEAKILKSEAYAQTDDQRPVCPKIEGREEMRPQKRLFTGKGRRRRRLPTIYGGTTPLPEGCCIILK